MNRRQFLNIGCTTALASMTGRLSAYTTPLACLSDRQVFSPKTNDIFVLIFLRGGCDALQLVAPVSDKNYIDARSNDLRINESGANKGLLLNNALNNLDFHLNPKASFFKELYDSKQLAIIHSVGLTNGTRSHFEAIDLIERGVLNEKNTANTDLSREYREGWLTRMLHQLSPEGSIPAVATGGSLPQSLLGSKNAVSMSKAKDFELHNDPRLLGLLKQLYQGEGLMNQTALKTIDTVRFLNKKLPRRGNDIIDYKPSSNANYPQGDYSGELSNNLQTLAQMIKMDVGVQVATVDYGGWDTHENQNYHFPRLVEGLTKSVGAFYNDLNAYQSRLNILVMSEFGRRLKSNKSNGTDHGYGGIMFALGGHVNGGKMYGKWNGLATEQLDNRVDLAVTTDYRTVLSEFAAKRLNINKLDAIFPNFKMPQPLGFLS
jgi:uncharacterized protein (DUF1501 family)